MISTSKDDTDIVLAAEEHARKHRSRTALDRAFKLNISFMLDGALSSEHVADKNVQRALAKGRNVILVYIYQNPARAWNFVLSREIIEGRNIPLEAFVSQYFCARQTVKPLMWRYSEGIRVDLLVQAKDGEGGPDHP
jgi:hypothetical protein